MPPPEERPASLGMYDLPEVAAETDSWWTRVAARLRAAGVAGVPARLARDRAPHDLWTDQRLLLAQTCGWPLTTSLAGRVAVVAAPCYDLPGCEGPMHRSFVVVRADDPADDPAGLRGRVFALNGRDSNSGMNLPRALFAPLARGGRFFRAVIETGAHRASLAAVAEGRADAAAIDCVTFGLLQRHAPASIAGLRVVAETAPSPSLPFITSLATSQEEIAALRDALDQPADALALAGVTALPAAAYGMLRDLAAEAARLGYPELR